MSDQFTTADVVDLSTALQGENAILVGGQALNFWAERYYGRCPDELSPHMPFTSRDVDYFGLKDVARRVAQRLEGKLDIPGIDRATPNTALLTLTRADGRILEVDFLNSVLGIAPRDLLRAAVELIVPVKLEQGREFDVSVRLMHPVHVLVSRINNLMNPAVSRTDQLAESQAIVSSVVAREWIIENLESGARETLKEAIRSVREIFQFVRSDLYGRQAHIRTPVDPLRIIREIAERPEWSPRFRDHQIASMIRKIETRRQRIGGPYPPLAAFRSARQAV